MWVIAPQVSFRVIKTRKTDIGECYRVRKPVAGVQYSVWKIRDKIKTRSFGVETAKAEKHHRELLEHFKIL